MSALQPFAFSVTFLPSSLTLSLSPRSENFSRLLLRRSSAVALAKRFPVTLLDGYTDTRLVMFALRHTMKNSEFPATRK